MALYKLIVVVCCLVLARATRIEDVQDLNYEPRVAMYCGKVVKHVDVNTGEWINDANKTKYCSNNTAEILKYCQSTYPTIAITNIVEANENVTVKNWCAVEGDCESSHTVIPYRCLVGEFEADALSYPPDLKCDFGYIHEGKTCKGHDYWRDRAEHICVEKGKKLEKYGILVPCGTDLFQGVEYVCCKKPKTPAETFEDIVNQFASHIPAASKGCDRAKYDLKARLARTEREKKVNDLAKNLKEAKDRKDILQQDDPQQARAFFKNVIQVLQSTVKSIEKQGKLDERRIHQERRECLQIDINHRKHLAMKSFVNSLRHHIDNPTKILKTFKRFMHILETDQSQNARFLTKLLHSKSSQAKNAREAFVSHFNRIKSTLKEGVEALKQVKSVEGRIEFNLPSWASDIDFKWAHKPAVRTSVPKKGPSDVNPTDPPPKVTDGKGKGRLEDGKDKHKTLPQEHEHKDYDDHKNPLTSRAVFAAVIGLSCGALVIMVVIVMALFFRKGAPRRPTQTVIADDDSQEKRHLLKMQEDGFENPTYKFFVH